MKRLPSIDLSLVLSLATVLGMAMATIGKWPLNDALGVLELPGLVLLGKYGASRAICSSVSQ